MNSPTHYVKLTSDELLLLDTRVGPEVQSLIDKIKVAQSYHLLAPSEALMVATILQEARDKGKLTFVHTAVSNCPCCKHSEGYERVRRNTKWKRKGDIDHNHPILTPAWDLSRGFVIIQNSIRIGFCSQCRARVEPHIIAALANIKVATDPRWKECPHRYNHYENCKCKACGWTGHRGQLGFIPSLMGSPYPGECPQCKARDRFMTQNIEPLDGFTLVPVEN